MLVNCKTAGAECGVTSSMVAYMVRRGYVKRHAIPGFTRQFLVDLDEVREQLLIGREVRKRTLYNRNWSLYERDSRGRYTTEKKKTT